MAQLHEKFKRAQITKNQLFKGVKKIKFDNKNFKNGRSEICEWEGGLLRVEFLNRPVYK